MVKLVERTKWRRKAEVKEHFKKGTREAVHEAAEMMVRIIRADWSTSSPSPEGGPPGVKTGNLDSSIQQKDEGHIALRKIPNDVDFFVQFVTANTSEGDDPQGRGNYGVAIEEPYRRAFINPAIAQVAPLFPVSIKRRVSL